MKIALLSALLWAFSLAGATRHLMANALVPCENTNGITAKELSILYDHSTGNIYYNASVNVDFSGLVYADIDVFIYGIKAISTRLNPCAKGNTLKELCPVNAGEIDIESNSHLSHSITKHLPGIAFTVPDIDAWVIAKVKNDTTGEVLSCLYIEIQNSKTVEQTSVKWVTAVLSGLGLLISSLLVFLGTSVDSHNISAVTILMLTYFQSMAFLAMEAVERVPPIASAWCENIVWSVGLVYTSFLEKIFRWYVQATGGDPATYRIYATKPVLVQKLRKRAADAAEKMSPRSLDFLRNMQLPVLTPEGTFAETAHQLVRRDNAAAAESYAHSSSNLVVYRGIERLAYKMGIEVTSAVITSYTIFIFICVCTVFIFTVMWFLLGSSTKKERYEHENVNEKAYEAGEDDALASPRLDNISTTFTSYEGPLSRSAYFFLLLPSLLKGTLLKLWYVAFGPVMVFSMWEWTHNDSAAVIVVSVFMFVVCLVLVLSNVARVYFIARRSKLENGTSAYLLYANPKILQKYGFLYSMFDTKYYYFGFVYLVYNFVKALFLAFAQTSGKTQALAIFIIELAMFIAVAHLKPFLSRAVNAIQITSHVVITLNAMFFLFFSNLMTQPLIVNGVMGVIFFVLNAAFSLVLLLYIIIYSTLCIIWHKRQGGVRVDHRVKDDRNNYMVDRHGRTVDETDELRALGQAAQADHDTDINSEQQAWFHNQSAEAQNPFEPVTSPPMPQKRAERYSSVVSESRTQTMSSEMSSSNIQGDVFADQPPGHRITESQTSFGLTQQYDPSDISLVGGTAKPKKKALTNIFKKH